jgi:hypothetical protein
MEIPTAATFAGEKEENAPREKKRCDHKERKDHKNNGGRVFQPASDHLRKFELVWRLRSSLKKSKRWQQLKSNSNPPLSPFFKGGIFSVRFSPLFAKEGKGEIFEQNDAGII